MRDDLAADGIVRIRANLEKGVARGKAKDYYRGLRAPSTKAAESETPDEENKEG